MDIARMSYPYANIGLWRSDVSHAVKLNRMRHSGSVPSGKMACRVGAEIVYPTTSDFTGSRRPSPSMSIYALIRASTAASPTRWSSTLTTLEVARSLMSNDLYPAVTSRSAGSLRRSRNARSAALTATVGSQQPEGAITPTSLILFLSRRRSNAWSRTLAVRAPDTDGDADASHAVRHSAFIRPTGRSVGRLPAAKPL